MAFKAGTTGNCGIIQIPNGRWNGSLIGPEFPHRHQRRKDKTGPQHPRPLGGGGPHSRAFRATGRLYTAIAVVSYVPCHERCLAIKNPNPKWPVARVAI